MPNGTAVDSLGRPYDSTDIDFDEDDLVLEKVSLSLVDDLTVGDAVNFFSLHEAPYRPFLTYRARIALDGPLVHAPTGTTVNYHDWKEMMYKTKEEEDMFLHQETLKNPKCLHPSTDLKEIQTNRTALVLGTGSWQKIFKNTKKKFTFLLPIRNTLIT